MIILIIGYVEGIKDGVVNMLEKMDKYLIIIYMKVRYMDIFIDELFLFLKFDLNWVFF